MRRILVIDSHTAGEPTRVVLDGGPDLGTGPLAQRAEKFRTEHDHFRRLVANEPRGTDILVGALIVPPHDPTCSHGVIFFNNVGVIGMCGHGTIGLAHTLAQLGKITPGDHRIDTPVGPVTARLHPDRQVTVTNVPSYRYQKGVVVDVSELGQVKGDIAWGGNWFFLAELPGETIDLGNVERLTQKTWAIRRTLEANRITGADNGSIDHIELFGPPGDPANHGRNFVLCPGGAYDRSPCGTGTSAKLACLAADGKLKPGDVWRQESVLGTVFEGRYDAHENGTIIPAITGSAYLTAESVLLVENDDPAGHGWRPTVARPAMTPLYSDTRP
ncbi:MAG TPA: proline racemase family protein [Fimbriiglobus sp.]|jgi:4-hydroxyproline epimerase